MLKKILFFAAFLLSHALVAQTMWAEMPATKVTPVGERRIIPQKYRTFRLDLTAIQPLLSAAPERFTAAAADNATVLTLPMPDGTAQRFRLYESPVMAPSLQEKYSDIRCYTGRGLDNPTALLKCDLTPVGFHAQILAAGQNPVFIDPYQTGDRTHYVVYFKKDYLPSAENGLFSCGVETLAATELHVGPTPDFAGDCQLRRYRLALACTGEYAAFQGGTKPLVLAAMNTSMNRVNGVYENEFSVTMQIVANDDQIIFLNAATDPYTNDDGGTMLDENITTCDGVIGTANYDIGHVFSTGGGGVAGLGVVCGGSKAWGVTGGPQPVGDAFDIDYVAHEMGHQFGASHTQNNDCNHSGNASMEPGSASTIMGYAGICAPDVQPHSDDYFHAISIQEITSFITTGGNGCATKINIGNTAPTVNGGADRTIPKSTPFALTATGADVNGDTLSYCWEQMDPEFATMPPVATSSTGPLFRSFLPVVSPIRYFPRLSDLVNNTAFDWEELPGVARNMKFRVSARDNNYNGGCTGEDNVVVTVSGTAGPFVVTAPNTSIIWLVGSTQTVTWSVANTNLAPVNCANVRISLSTDGGFTYPVVLADSKPNTGTATVTVPDNVSNTCRVKVEAVGNIFFDISNLNFKIQTPPTPTFLLTANTSSQQICAGAAAVYTVSVASVAGFASPVQLAVSGAPTGAVVTLNQNPVATGDSAVITISGLTPAMAGVYNLTVLGTGLTIQQTINLQLTVLPGAPVGVASALSPVDGAVEVIANSVLTWNTVLYAQSYLVEVATNPTFSAGSIVLSQLTTNDSLFNAALQPGTVYYWHVRADNDCGQGGFSTVVAFETNRSVCNQVFSSVDVPKTIDASSVNTIQSTLAVAANKRIGDINLFVTIDHTWVGDLAATLSSPTGENFLLFSQPGVPADNFGCSNDNVDVTFDDAATLLADDFENTCDGNSPAVGGTFQPVQPLTALNGQVAQGNWKLSVTDNFAEDGGALVAWGLNFCFTDTLVAGELLTNNVLLLGSGTTATITDAYLKMKTAALATQGQFTLLSLPAHGNLRLNGTTLAIGSVFTQADLNAGTITYKNNGDTGTSDQFTFDGYDASNAAWIHNAVFHISIVQNNLAATAAQTQMLLCHNGDSGQITVMASGLDGQFQYSLNGGASQNSNVFSSLSAGTYTVVVSGQYGFTVTANTVEITNPVALQASASVTADVVAVTATGGASTLQYSIDGQNFQSAAIFENVPNGIYTVIVKDANGCTVQTQAIVAVNTLLASLEIQSSVLCNGGNQGAITVNTGGGQAPFTYSLNGGMPQTSNTFQNLEAGTYTVEVVDNLGFTVLSNSVELTAPSVVVATASANLNVITVTATGGAGIYQYSLDGQSFQVANTFGNLSNGLYMLTVKDANGCTAITEATVNVAPIIGTVLITSALPCFAAQTATIQITPSGGVPPYQYQLDNGAFQSGNAFSGLGAGSYTVTIRDAAGVEQTLAPITIGQLDAVVVTVAVTENNAAATTVGGAGGPYTYSLDGILNAPLTDLANGAYTLVAIDQTSGCTGETSFQINFTPLAASVSVFDVEPCDEMINLIVSALGGTPPFQYSLDGLAYSSDSIFTDVAAGVHTILVRDAQGQIFNLPFDFTLPPTVTLTTAVLGDSIVATGSAGNAPYEYSLDGINYQASSVFGNLPAGSYTVTVRDNGGCTATVTNVLIITASSDPELVWGVSVMPNPSAGLFQIRFENGLTSAMHLELLDIAGRSLRNWNLEQTSGQFTTPLDLVQYSEGTYILRLTDGKNWAAMRLQVVR